MNYNGAEDEVGELRLRSVVMSPINVGERKCCIVAPVGCC